MMALFLQPHFLNPTPSLSSTNPPFHLCKKSRFTQSPPYFLIIQFSYLFFFFELDCQTILSHPTHKQAQPSKCLVGILQPLHLSYKCLPDGNSRTLLHPSSPLLSCHWSQSRDEISAIFLKNACTPAALIFQEASLSF